MNNPLKSSGLITKTLTPRGLKPINAQMWHKKIPGQDDKAPLAASPEPSGAWRPAAASAADIICPVYVPVFILCFVQRAAAARRPLCSPFGLFTRWQRHDASSPCDCTQRPGGLREEAGHVTVASAAGDVVQTHGAPLSKQWRLTCDAPLAASQLWVGHHEIHKRAVVRGQPSHSRLTRSMFHLINDWISCVDGGDLIISLSGGQRSFYVLVFWNGCWWLSPSRLGWWPWHIRTEPGFHQSSLLVLLS